MKLTVITPDRFVQVDGSNAQFDFTIDSNIHAIQWYGIEGHIEYNDGTPNLDITDISTYEYLVTAHADELVRLAQEEVDRLANRTYDELRFDEGYDPIADQLDALFRDIDNGTLDNTGEFYTHIKTVKDTYPKP